MTGHRRVLQGSSVAALLTILIATQGCGPAGSTATTTAGEDELGGIRAVLETSNLTNGNTVNGMSQNGMSQNGMSQNGMSQNGMSQNGLATSGLTAAGLGTATFATWFNTAPVLNAVVMSYVVKCAMPTGASLAWTNPTTMVAYNWPGNLGVAPRWASGQPMAAAEQQLLTACLAAHVNKFGLRLAIAVEGSDATGAPLVMAPGELTTYPLRESCFFGNVFDGSGVFAGIDHAAWPSYQASLRACAFDYAAVGTTRDCPPIKVVGACDQLCTRSADGVSYTTCSYGGKNYRALATRINTAVLSVCGDGRCDASESCGTGTTWNNCGRDCGPCGSGSTY